MIGYLEMTSSLSIKRKIKICTESGSSMAMADTVLHMLKVGTDYYRHLIWHGSYLSQPLTSIWYVEKRTNRCIESLYSTGSVLH